MSVRMAKSGKDRVSNRVQTSQNGKTDTHNTSSKNQPTAEQMRLAQLSNDRAYNTSNNSVDGDTIKKINQIAELTGRSHDEALTALYDCDSDLNRAVDKLLEKPDAESEWQEIGKKKKPVSSKNMTTGGGDQQTQDKDERGCGGSFQDAPLMGGLDNDRERNDSVTRGGRKDRDRAPPRFQQRGGRGRGYGGNYNTGFNDRVGRDRGGFDGPPRGGMRRGENGMGRSRGGERGGSTFNGGSHFDTHIDTWTNEATQNGESSGNVKESETGTIGAWSDMAEEWAPDEWSGSLEESRVFTPSISTQQQQPTSTFSSAPVVGDVSSSRFDSSQQASPHSSAAGAIGQSYVDGSLQQQHVYTAAADSTAAAGGDGISYRSHQPTAAAVYATTATTQQLYNLAQMATSSMPVVDSYSGVASNATYMSHFTKEATECIKNAVGIGSSSSSGQVVVSGLQQQLSSNNRTKQQQIKPRLPPPSKIPQSAVEMPGSMNSGQLDVQFGNWDTSPSSVLSSVAPQDTGLSFMSERDSLFHDHSQAFSNSAAGAMVGSGVTGDIQQTAQHPVPPPGLDVQQQPLTSTSSASAAAASLLQHMAKADPAVIAGSTFPVQPLQTAASVAAVDKRSTPINPAAAAFAQQSSSSQSAEAAQTSSLYKSQQLQQQQQQTQSHAAAAYSSYSSYTQSTGLPGSVTEYGVSNVAASNTQYDAYPAAYGSTNQSSTGFTSNGSVYHGSSGYNGSTQQQGSSGYGNSASSSSSASKLYDNMKQPAAGSYGASTLFQSAAAGSDRPQQYIAPNTASAANLYDPAAAYQSTANQQQQQGYGGSLYSGGSSEGLQLSSGMYDTQYNSQQQLYQQKQQQQSVASYQQPQSAVPPSHTSSSSQTSASAYRTNQQQSTTTPQVSSSVTSISSSTGPVVTSSSKLVDGLNKLTMKEGVSAPPGIGGVQYEPVSSAVAGVGPSSGATSTSVVATSVTSTVASAAASVTKSLSTSITSTTKSSSFPNKGISTMPPGIPQGTVVNQQQQHNYLLGQPPGFQVAAYGYPTAQQPMTYTYDDLQMMQTRMPMPYYDMPFQTSTTLSSRDANAAAAAAIGSLGTQSYPDLKLNPMDALSPVSAVQPSQPNQTQQQQPGLTGAGSQQQQQAGYPAALHPAAYSFYYPSAAGIQLPYGYHMIPVGGMAVPSVTNAAHGATTSATQYQKGSSYGSHSYGQTQDFSKAFGASAAPNKGSIVTPVIGGGPTNDMASSGFGKGHMGGFDKTGAFHHGGTPPPFNMTLQSGTGQAGAGGSGAAGANIGVPQGVYPPPYMPMTVQPQHQPQSQSQMLHHGMPQDNSMTGRGGVQPGSMGQKVATNKMYGGGGYNWSGN